MIDRELLKAIVAAYIARPTDGIEWVDAYSDTCDFISLGWNETAEWVETYVEIGWVVRIGLDTSTNLHIKPTAKGIMEAIS